MDVLSVLSNNIPELEENQKDIMTLDKKGEDIACIKLIHCVKAYFIFIN